MTAISLRSCCERGKREGFTLVEVLVVVAIMSILTGLVTSAVTVGYKKALKTQTRAMITGIEMAVADFQYDEGYYPASDVRDRERNATCNARAF
jgi:prepilin-type N-terminal cleavage/methylation domain-containing protein